MRRNGFSLIEILIAIAISLLAAGAAIAGYRNFNTGKRADVAAEEVYSQLVLIKSKAVSGEKMLSPEYCLNLHHYEVEWNGSNLAYYQYCSDDNGIPESIDTEGKGMESGSYEPYLSCAKTSQTSDCSVEFNALSGSTIDNISHSFYIVIDSTCEREIEVERNGNITIKNCD